MPAPSSDPAIATHSLRSHPRPARSLGEIVPGYELLEELGRGGMGIVFKARQIGLDRVVALKMILGARFACAEELLRFRLEGESAASLQHPNVVQVHEVGTHDGQPFLVLEYVEGGTLAERLDGAALPPPQAARLVEVLARAVHAAHARGIIHRDLKPSNVLMQPHPAGEETACLVGDQPFTPKVADFGLAKHLGGGRLTETGRVLGTPEYMAPEQAAGRGRDVGPAADVWALGAILYECLTGGPPFRADDTAHTMLRLLSSDPPPPRRSRPAVPRDLETIALKCLEKEPARRYATAAELADDLRRFLDGKPIKARPVGLAERACKWARRRPVVAGLTAGLVLVSVAGFVAVTAALLYALRGWQEADAQAELVRGEKEAAERARGLAQAAQAAEQAERLKADRARAVAETNVAFSRLAQARLEWRHNHLTASQRLLAQIEPARRGWEWRYLQGLHRGELRLLSRPGLVVVHGVTFSPDGRQVVASGGNMYGPNPHGVAVVWDVESGKLVRSLGGFRHVGNRVACSPDGTRLAACSHDAGLRIWDAATGRLVRSLRANRGELYDLAWSPDGRHLVAASAAGAALVCEADTGKLAALLHRGNGVVRHVAWSPDGKTIAVAGDQLALWEWPSRRQRCRMAVYANGLSFSPDGQLFACGDGPVVRVWSADGSHPRHTLSGHEGPVLAVSFSPDSRLLVTGSADATVRVWDVDQGRQSAVWRGHLGRVNCVGFHPDGWAVVSGSSQPGDVRVWDLTRTQECLHVHDPIVPYRVEALAFDAAGREVLARGVRGAIGVRGGLELRDATAGVGRPRRVVPISTAWRVPGTLSDFSGDGRLLAGVRHDDEASVGVWIVADGRPLPAVCRHSITVWRVSCNRDGAVVASGGRDVVDQQMISEFAVWETASGKVRLRRRLEGEALHALAISGDGATVAVGLARVTTEKTRGGTVLLRGAASRVEVWDVPAAGRPAPERPRLVRSTGLENVAGLAFRGDGAALAVVTTAGGVTLLELPSGQPWPGGPLRGPAGLEALAFSPDGRLLAGANRSEVTLWDVRERQEVLTLRGAPPRPGDNGFSPRLRWSGDGRRLASSNWDCSVSIWEGDHADALQAARRRLPAWHLTQARAALGGARRAAAEYHLRRIDAAAPLEPEYHANRGDLYGLLGRWEQAAADHARALDGSPGEAFETWRRHATLRLWLKDEAGYRRPLADLVRRGAAAPHADDVSHLVLTCSLRPGAVPAALTDRLRKEHGKLGRRLHPLALADLRAGRFAESIRASELSLADPAWQRRQALSWLALALAHHGLGQREEATTYWQQARAWLEAERRSLAATGQPVPAGVGWCDWLWLQLLETEARRTLGREA